jgi:hypothetical protein
VERRLPQPALRGQRELQEAARSSAVR